MIGLCIFYFVSVQKKTSTPITSLKKPNIEKQLESQQTQILDQYPKTPQALIEFHNELMRTYYRSQKNAQETELYVDTIRLLYSNELLQLNDRALQISGLLQEAETYKQTPIILLKSETKEIDFLEKEDKATMRVIHFTNKSDINRLYTLKKQDGLWKIDEWKDDNQAEAKDD